MSDGPAATRVSRLRERGIRIEHHLTLAGDGFVEDAIELDGGAAPGVDDDAPGVAAGASAALRSAGELARQLESRALKASDVSLLNTTSGTTGLPEDRDPRPAALVPLPRPRRRRGPSRRARRLHELAARARRLRPLDSAFHTDAARRANGADAQIRRPGDDRCPRAPSGDGARRRLDAVHHAARVGRLRRRAKARAAGALHRRRGGARAPGAQLRDPHGCLACCSSTARTRREP